MSHSQSLCCVELPCQIWQGVYDQDRLIHHIHYHVNFVFIFCYMIGDNSYSCNNSCKNVAEYAWLPMYIYIYAVYAYMLH